MFRNTAFTGMIDIDGEWQHATIQIDDDPNTTIFKKVRVDTNGVDHELSGTERWKSISQMRRRLSALIRADGRRSASAASMFVVPQRQITDRKGSVGRTYTTEQFIAYVLTWSDAEYRGETQADRERDADIIRTFLTITG